MIHLTLWEWFLRLAAATLLGALVGVERERGVVPGGRPAGLRTLSLVSLGSALFMLVSAYGFTAFTSDAYAKVDPSRIAAQVVSGIGFLGAGAILLRRNVVRGLTTAAAVWVVAAIGLACGLGLVAEAGIATLLGLFILEVLRPIERRLFPSKHTQRIHVRVASDADAGQTLAAIYDTLALTGARLDAIELSSTVRGDEIELRCHAADPRDLVHALAALHDLPGVQAVGADVHTTADAGQTAADAGQTAADAGQTAGTKDIAD